MARLFLWRKKLYRSMSLKTLKRGDTVKVLSGKDKGKTAKVMNVFPKEDRIIVEGVNIKKRHQRSKKQGAKGQVVQMSMPFHISNVMLVCSSCKKPTRRSVTIRQDGSRARSCKKCKAEL